jgi:hypothetical protein
MAIRDGSKQKYIGFRYNYVSGVIGIWKPDSDEPVSTLTLDREIIKKQVQSFDRKSSKFDKYDATLLKLIDRDVTIIQGGPGKLFHVVQSYAQNFWK